VRNACGGYAHGNRYTGCEEEFISHERSPYLIRVVVRLFETGMGSML
jgi:hypothetical protein